MFTIDGIKIATILLFVCYAILAELRIHQSDAKIKNYETLLGLGLKS